MAIVGEVVTTLGVEEARALTEQVKRDAKSLWHLMARLYEGGAHMALGYSSWHEYCKEEFGFEPTVAQRLLDAGRVVAAVEARGRASLRVPSQHVAITLARLLPPTNQYSAVRGRSGSEERVAEAWSLVVEESEKRDEPVTAAFTKKVLVQSGFLPDTRGAQGQPGWLELIGTAADWLIAAGKTLDRLEAQIEQRGRHRITPKMREKATRYAGMARSLAERFEALAEDA